MKKVLLYVCGVIALTVSAILCVVGEDILAKESEARYR